jgi:hypothetical protein
VTSVRTVNTKRSAKQFPRTPRRDLEYFDPRVSHDRVERSRKLTGPIADEEPEPGGTFAEIHDEVAGLLCRPGPVGIPGHAQNMQVAVADLEHEQHVEASQRHRAVDVEEIDREHAGGLRATSWRSTRSSMSLAEDVRHDSRTNPSTCQKIKYSNRSDTPGSCPTSHHRWSATQARLLAPHRPPASSELSGRGRGIPMMHELMDSVLISYDGRGTRVLLRHVLPVRPEL